MESLQSAAASTHLCRLHAHCPAATLASLESQLHTRSQPRCVEFCFKDSVFSLQPSAAKAGVAAMTLTLRQDVSKPTQSLAPPVWFTDKNWTVNYEGSLSKKFSKVLVHTGCLLDIPVTPDFRSFLEMTGYIYQYEFVLKGKRYFLGSVQVNVLAILKGDGSAPVDSQDYLVELRTTASDNNEVAAVIEEMLAVAELLSPFVEFVRVEVPKPDASAPAGPP
mmetsp:Transcript_32204/g.80796  ORF Transcript_32204/g.80796 Transcript_32204/m.80796 type:complete len:221 (-) Transcript_32204:37-699(-)